MSFYISFQSELTKSILQIADSYANKVDSLVCFHYGQAMAFTKMLNNFYPGEFSKEQAALKESIHQQIIAKYGENIFKSVQQDYLDQLI